MGGADSEVLASPGRDRSEMSPAGEATPLLLAETNCRVPPSMLEGMDGGQETLGRGLSATNLEDTGPLQGRMRAGLKGKALLRKPEGVSLLLQRV